MLDRLLHKTWVVDFSMHITVRMVLSKILKFYLRRQLVKTKNYMPVSFVTKSLCGQTLVENMKEFIPVKNLMVVSIVI